MIDRHQKLAAIFRDTQAACRDDSVLRAAVAESRDGTTVYPADEYPALPPSRHASCTLEVTGHRTFEAAMLRHAAYPAERIGVLNFASGTHPGGGVFRGASAQEECLCRCSTLYPCLAQDAVYEAFYEKNIDARDPLGTDACIYTPGVVIFKTDTAFPQRMPESDWCSVDVLSCAAPHLARSGDLPRSPFFTLSPDAQYRIHASRARHILHIAAARGLDTLILGAFGCGAFSNDPDAVARAYRDVLPTYAHCFRHIEFAVFCHVYDAENHAVFASVFA